MSPYRIIPTGVSWTYTGYGPGRWLIQYRDTYNKIWFDIGDPKDTFAEAEAALDAWIEAKANEEAQR